MAPKAAISSNLFVRAPLYSLPEPVNAAIADVLWEKLVWSADNIILYWAKLSGGPGSWYSLDLKTEKSGRFAGKIYDGIMARDSVEIEAEGPEDEDEIWEI